MNRTGVRVARCLALSLFLLASATRASAQTNWTAGVGLWTDAANWSSGIPTAGTDATISNGGTGRITTAGQACNNLVVGGPTPSSVEVTGAGAVSCAQLSVANNVGGNGSVTVSSGGRISVTGILTGAGAAATITVTGSGSRIAVSGQTLLGGSPPSGGTTVVNIFDAGEFSSPTIELGGAATTATINVGNGGIAGVLEAGATTTAGSGTATVNFNHSNNITYGFVLSGALVLNKLGTGTLTLTGNNTHTGATTISAGTLLVNGSQGSSNVTVTGGTLGGTGTVGTITATGGTIAPGVSPGILNSGTVRALRLRPSLTYSSGTWV